MFFLLMRASFLNQQKYSYFSKLAKKNTFSCEKKTKVLQKKKTDKSS
jgi:hypothetical protein